MFGLYPPFQMDANFGTTAGIAEMLLQSQSGEIRLLPTLPKAWRNKGFMCQKRFCARHEMDIKQLRKASRLFEKRRQLYARL